jgi:hypothetical protein
VGAVRCLGSVKKHLMTTASTFHAFPAPSGMISTITETSLNKDFNGMLLAADGAVNVLAADVLDIGYGYQGLRSTFETPSL